MYGICDKNPAAVRCQIRDSFSWIQKAPVTCPSQVSEQCWFGLWKSRLKEVKNKQTNKNCCATASGRVRIEKRPYRS